MKLYIIESEIQDELWGTAVENLKSALSNEYIFTTKEEAKQYLKHKIKVLTHKENKDTAGFLLDLSKREIESLKKAKIVEFDLEEWYCGMCHNEGE